MKPRIMSDSHDAEDILDVAGLLRDGREDELLEIYKDPYDWEIEPGLYDLDLIFRSRKIFEAAHREKQEWCVDSCIGLWMSVDKFLDYLSRADVAILPDHVNLCLYFMTYCTPEDRISEYIFLTRRRELIDKLLEIEAISHKMLESTRLNDETGSEPRIYLPGDNSNELQVCSNYHSWFPRVVREDFSIDPEQVRIIIPELSSAWDYADIYYDDTPMDTRLDVFLFLAEYKDHMDWHIKDILEDITGIRGRTREEILAGLPAGYPQDKAEQILAAVEL